MDLALFSSCGRGGGQELKYAVIYKEQVDFVIGVEGDPIRGCVTV